MPRGNPQNLKRGGSPGRPKGLPNKATLEIKALARNLLENPQYLEALTRRLQRGTAGAVEPLLFHYGYGRPVEHVDITGSIDLAGRLQRARERLARADD